MQFKSIKRVEKDLSKYDSNKKIKGTVRNISSGIATSGIKSATSAWRYLASNPRERLVKKQLYTRQLEARLRLKNEIEKQKMLEKQLQTRSGFASSSPYYMSKEEYENYHKDKGGHLGRGNLL